MPIKRNPFAFSPIWAKRRFKYGDVEIYIPLRSRICRVYLNGRATIIVSRAEAIAITEPEGREHIIAKLKAKGLLAW